MLGALVFASALACIVSDAAGRRRLVYVFKPLTMLFVLARALGAGAAAGPAYQRAIAAGLVFSLVGDVLLMLPTDHFAAGLASFLVAHLLYIAAFAPGAGPLTSPAALVPFALAAVLVFWAVRPGLGRLAPAVVVYMVVIALMGWQATARWLALGTGAAGLACAGAVLFVASDGALAFSRFRRPFAAAQAVVLSTYFAAQWLIARSVGAAGVL
jgi:uncharacterized membrane protein YhhN